MNQDHFRKLEKMYAGAPINQYFRPRLVIGEGRAELRLSMRPDFFHAAQAVHGSVYFKALDDSAFFAANSLVEDVFVLTASFSLHLLKPIREGEMIATASVVSKTRSLIVADTVVHDGAGAQLARGTGTFMRSAVPLTEEIGYRL
jgi:uncharacterized protein (TIGR00369 family)